MDVMLVANCSSPEDCFPSSQIWCLALLCGWEFADAVVQPERAEVGSRANLGSRLPPEPSAGFTPGLQWEGMVRAL